MKGIGIEIKSIQEVKGHWRLIEQCEWMVIWNLHRQMDEKAKWQNMNWDLEENWDAKQEFYETPIQV
jgi:hypothetical protein